MTSKQHTTARSPKRRIPSYLKVGPHSRGPAKSRKRGSCPSPSHLLSPTAQLGPLECSMFSASSALQNPKNAEQLPLTIRPPCDFSALSALQSRKCGAVAPSPCSPTAVTAACSPHVCIQNTERWRALAIADTNATTFSHPLDPWTPTLKRELFCGAFGKKLRYKPSCTFAAC